MRYSILGFNQEELIKYNVDMTDVLLLDYIQRALAQPSMHKTVDEDNQPYVWLQHKKILEDLPILDIKENMLKKRLSKLVELNLIKHINIANNQGRGSRTYYTITELFESLQLTTDNLLPLVNTTTGNKLPLVDGLGVINYPPNNKLINNNKLNNNTISKDIVEKSKSKKLSLYDKCMNCITDFTDDAILQSMLEECLKIFLTNSRESGIPFYTNNFKGKLNKLKSLSTDNYVQRDIVKQTIDNGWNGFYELKKTTRTAGDARTNIERLSTKTVPRLTDEEIKERNRRIENGELEQF